MYKSYQAHKTYCNCKRCEEAKALLKSKRMHKLPRQVLAAWQERKAKEEASLLSLGYMKIECPWCKHIGMYKVSSNMTCTMCEKGW